MLKRLILSLLMFSGCAGTGFNKQATLMPDSAGIYYEAAPTGEQRNWRDLKIGLRSDWKFIASTIKEKNNVSDTKGNNQAK